MFIDYLTLMMFNVAAGLAVLAFWIHFDFEGPGARRWAPAMLIVALLGMGTGFHMVLTWPLTGQFNIVFGEPYLFFAMIMLGLAVSVYLGLDLLPIAVFSTFAGFVSVLMSYIIYTEPLTKHPGMSSLTFLVSGIIGLLSVPMYLMRNNANFKRLAVLGLAVACVLWVFTGFGSYQGHTTGGFSKWKPIHMGYQIEMNKPKE